jgi:hypothetical protein
MLESSVAAYTLPDEGGANGATAGVTESKARASATSILGSWGSRLGLTFVAGMLVGWIVLGWWLLPVRWINAAPSDLRVDYQKMFISLIAEEYWQTGDISRVREALADWDDEELANLVAAMERGASTVEERQRLAALASVLALPETKTSLLGSLFGQGVFLISLLVAAVPLVVAATIVVLPRLRGRMDERPEQVPASEEEQLEEALEDLLAQEEPQEEEENLSDEYEAQRQEEEPPEETEREEDGAIVEGRPEVSQEEEPQAEPEIDEAQEEEEEEEEEEEDDDDDDDEESAKLQSTQDVFLSFIDEDETLSKLEELCKGLPEIDVDDLLKEARKAENNLRRSNRMHLM